MNYRIIPVTAFAQNCSLIWCEQTRLAALVDPGGDAERIKQEVAAAGVSLMQILLTHGHLDHVGAAAELAQHYGVPIIGPEKKMSSGWKVCRRKAGCLVWRIASRCSRTAGSMKATSSAWGTFLCRCCTVPHTPTRGLLMMLPGC